MSEDAMHTLRRNAKVTHQIELERTFSKNQTVPRIRAEFEACPYPLAAYMAQHKIPEDFGFDMLVQIAIHKVADLSTMVGLLQRHFDSAQLCADMLHRAALTDLIRWRPDMRKFTCEIPITQDVQDDLDRFQYPLPMVVEPQPIVSNTDTGYYLDHRSVILKKNHHTDDVCLDHLNRMNQIKLTINDDVMTMIQNKWRNLDKPKAGETKAKFDKRKRAFEKYDRTARDVMNYLMKIDREFYLTNAYDKRGRVYCRGYHVSFQGTPWNKATIEMAEKELVT